MENRLENRELQYGCGQSYGGNKLMVLWEWRKDKKRNLAGKFMEEVIAELSLGRQMGITLSERRL